LSTDFGRLYEFRVQDSVGFDVEKLAPLFHVLAQATFVPHPDLLHDATGGRVDTEMMRMNAIEAKVGERVTQDRSGGFRTVSAIPVRFADPVTQLGAFLFEIERRPIAPMSSSLALRVMAKTASLKSSKRS
jgi:hypothetical protein